MNDAYFIAAQAGVCPLATGIPGAAKTALVYEFARSLERECYAFIGSIREPSDMGIPFQSAEADYYNLSPPKWAHLMSLDPGKWILFLDELTTCPPATQAAMLRVVAERHVGDLPLGDDVIVCAACKPSCWALRMNRLAIATMLVGMWVSIALPY